MVRPEETTSESCEQDSQPAGYHSSMAKYQVCECDIRNEAADEEPIFVLGYN